MPEPKSVALKELDDVIETLYHATDDHTESERYVRAKMFRALHEARDLCERLEKDENNRVKLARETVEMADHPGIPVED